VVHEAVEEAEKQDEAKESCVKDEGTGGRRSERVLLHGALELSSAVQNTVHRFK
jgi:hypothetical protein